jgi:hypothetical protein
MRFSAWLAAGKLTLLARRSTTSRTTDGEYLSWARVLFHGGKWKRSTRIFKSSVRHRTPDFELESGGVSLLLADVGRFPS